MIRLIAVQRNNGLVEYIGFCKSIVIYKEENGEYLKEREIFLDEKQIKINENKIAQIIDVNAKIDSENMVSNTQQLAQIILGYIQA